jgi:hypothetical protein
MWNSRKETKGNTPPALQKKRRKKGITDMTRVEEFGQVRT